MNTYDLLINSMGYSNSKLFSRDEIERLINDAYKAGSNSVIEQLTSKIREIDPLFANELERIGGTD